MRACWRTSSLWVVLAVVVLCACGWTQEQQEYLPKNIVFSGSTLSQEELLAFTGLRASESLTRDRMQAATDKLTGTGLFTNVQFGFDGETLTFELQPSPTVVPAEYANFPWWDDKALNAAVAARVPLFHGALYPGGPMRDEVGRALAALVATKGVQGAVIATAPVWDAHGDQKAILYHIDAPPVVVEGFHVEDYSGVWTKPVLEVEKSAAGIPFDGLTRDKLADALHAAYGRLGFIGMTMTTPALGEPKLVNGQVVVPLRASITSEGGQYKVAGLHLNGDVFMTQEQFLRSAKLHPGDVANQDLWRQIEEMVAAPYKAHGYIDAKIDAEPTLDRANHTVDYTITVQPGPAYRVAKLTLTGLDDQQKAELMPYWLLHEGDEFNIGLVPLAMKHYHEQRAVVLQSIHGDFDAKWSVNPIAHTVDVVVKFDQPQN
jgi:outer membrane protein insertion porin family